MIRLKSIGTLAEIQQYISDNRRDILKVSGLYPAEKGLYRVYIEMKTIGKNDGKPLQSGG